MFQVIAIIALIAVFVSIAAFLVFRNMGREATVPPPIPSMLGVHTEPEGENYPPPVSKGPF